MDPLANSPEYSIIDLSMENRKYKEEYFDDIAFIQDSIPEFERPYPKKELIRRLDQSPGNSLVLACYNNLTPIGFAISYNKSLKGNFETQPFYDCSIDNELYIWLVGISPKHRGNRIASSLLSITEWWATEIGYSKLSLKTFNHFENMKGLLDKKGFRIEGEKPSEGSITYSKDIRKNSPIGFSHSGAYQRTKERKISLDVSWNIVPPWIR